jgi:tRNA1(Val) A37 N6-methylase TrmN6
MIQRQFTYNYSQPDDYHFSLDSIELPFKVAQLLERENHHNLKVMDLCSGCGVVGLELHFHLPAIRELNFVEVQREAYEKFIHENISKVKPSETQFQIHWMNYEKLLSPEYMDQFDLVVSNPPYFEPDQGKLSPSQFKNRCRFYLDSPFETLIDVLLHILKPMAPAYILLRSLEEHNKNLRQRLQLRTLGRAQVQVIDLIRGTELVKILKNS